MTEAIRKGTEHIAKKGESSTCALLPALYDRAAEAAAAGVAIQHLLWMLGRNKTPKPWPSPTCA